MGTKDAAKYFKTDRGAIVGEVILGTTFIFGMTIPAAIVISLVKPTNLQNSQNPNNNLLNTNTNYKEGYVNAAKIKKKKGLHNCFYKRSSGSYWNNLSFV